MENDVQCNHVTLSLLAGALHPSGKDYVCHGCGQQFIAEPFVIGVSYGKPPAAISKPCSHERLNEEGICRACGADKRGIG